MPGPKSDKIWSAAIRKAVHEYIEVEDEEGKKEKHRAINLLATNFVRLALKGDVQATKEIGDRLDGKPHQTAETKHQVENTYVALMPEVSQDAEEWQNKNAPTIQ